LNFSQNSEDLTELVWFVRPVFSAVPWLVNRMYVY